MAAGKSAICCCAVDWSRSCRCPPYANLERGVLVGADRVGRGVGQRGALQRGVEPRGLQIGTRGARRSGRAGQRAGGRRARLLTLELGL